MRGLGCLEEIVIMRRGGYDALVELLRIEVETARVVLLLLAVIEFDENFIFVLFFMESTESM